MAIMAMVDTVMVMAMAMVVIMRKKRRHLISLNEF